MWKTLPVFAALLVGLVTVVGAVADTQIGEEQHVRIKGNLNCDYYFGNPIDALDHLLVQQGYKGVPVYCVRLEMTEDGCPNYSGPPSTQCDTPSWFRDSPGPTSDPGELPPQLLDIDCDGAVGIRDTLYLLKSILAFQQELPAHCDELGTTTQVD